MTDRKDEMLDKLAQEIGADSLDEATTREVTASVWQRIAAEREGPISGCADFQALIPGLVAGELSAARSLLVEDHTRECVPCRRALMEARGTAAESIQAPRIHRPRRLPRSIRLAAAAVVILGIGTLALRTTGNLLADRRLEASVATVDGTLQLVADDEALKLVSGDEFRSRRALRTAKDSRAELRLADGSVIEMDARAELELNGAMRGTTIRLHRGNIIVRAADQGNDRLYVATDDCLVAVKGTIFAVDHGLKGSRVAVIEGEVEVRQHGRQDLLAPGEQLTTNEILHAVAIEEQIAWSPNAEQHLALLHELTALQRELADVVEPKVRRTSTGLLDLAPDNTAVYAALPNLAEGLGEARRLVEERLAASAALDQWWQTNVVASGLDRELDEMLDRLQPLGEAVGDEVVITVPITGITGEDGPLVLARLDDPATFRALLADEVERANTAAGGQVLALVDEPFQAPEAQAEMLLWVNGDLFAAASTAAQLSQLAGRLSGSVESAFNQSELYARLSEAYGRGVGWLVGVDMAKVLDTAAADGNPQDAEMLERLGILDATTLILARSRDDESASIDAGLYFAGSRHGMAAWLAEPAPMGSLEFISPQATLATAVVAKDAALMFDEMLTTIAGVDADAMAELEAFETEIGFDLRADFAATLGGEAAFAVDGPLLPVPSWKLIVEVYDPITLQATIERAVDAANRSLAAHDQGELVIEHSSSGGHSYHSVRHSDSGSGVVYLMVDGYLVMAPSRTLLDQALDYRASGVTLPRSASFVALLPAGGYAGCSAIFYRNLGLLEGALPQAVVSQLPAAALELIRQGSEPSLLCAYGLEDRVLMSGSGGSLLGAGPLLGLSSLMSEIRMDGPTMHAPTSSDPV